jgi:hypothetical protein
MDNDSNSNFYTITKQAQDLKQRIQRDSEKFDEKFRIGIEIEVCLLDHEGKPVDTRQLIEELKGTEYEIDSEYGICQFEYRTPPMPMENLLDLNVLFEQFIEQIDRAVQKVYKMKEMVFPVFLGANPSSEILKEDLITEEPILPNKNA